jgi:hypothetical protein
MRPRALAALIHCITRLATRPSRPFPQSRLFVEELESRLTPSGALIVAPVTLSRPTDAPVTFSTNAGTAITVSDSAIGNGQDTVYVQALGGTLTANNTSALAAIGGNGSSLVTLTGTLAALNAALDGLVYVPPTQFSGLTGLDALIVPSSGPDVSAFVSLDFADGLTIQFPASPSLNGDQSLTFSAANGNAIAVTDPSNFGGTDTVWIEVSDGTLALGNQAGIGALSGDYTSFIELTGTLPQINTALDGLTYTPSSSFPGLQYLSISVFDSGGASASASTPITVIAGNFAPTLDGPLSQEIPGTGVLSFSPANGNAITLADPDSGDSIETLYLETTTGSLAVLNTAGLTSIQFTQSPTYSIVHYLTIAGTVPAVNAAFNGLEYQAFPGTASDSLFISVTDSSGAGASLTVQLTNYGYTDIAPTVTGLGFQAFTNAGATFSQANGNAIHVADGDANGLYETAYVQVARGTLTVSSGTSLGVNGNGTSDLIITGTVAHINAALDGLHYTPAGNHVSDFLNVLAGDGARTGSLAMVLGPDSSATLAPVIAVPGAQSDYVGSLLTFSEGNSSAIQLSAGDANGAIELLVLQTLQGRLEVGDTANLATINGNGSSLLTMTGTIAALNTAIDGLEYAAPAVGDIDFLSVEFGNNGSAGGAARTTFAGVSIALFPPPDNC